MEEGGSLWPRGAERGKRERSEGQREKGTYIAPRISSETMRSVTPRATPRQTVVLPRFLLPLSVLASGDSSLFRLASLPPLSLSFLLLLLVLLLLPLLPHLHLSFSRSRHSLSRSATTLFTHELSLIPKLFREMRECAHGIASFSCFSCFLYFSLKSRISEQCQSERNKTSSDEFQKYRQRRSNHRNVISNKY